MSTSIFLKPLDYYQRKINPLGQYVEQMGFYLHRSSGKPLEQCREYVVKGIREKKFQDIKDPIVSYFERGDNLDRHSYEMPLSKYISTSVQDRQIMAPTFTTYVPPDQSRSLLVKFTDNNTKRRSTAKKEAAVAKAEKDMNLYVTKHNEQDNMKRYNNSLSGAFNAGGSVLRNPTAHSTLTSVTRTLSSLSNASNEKIIAGNRHYHDPKVTLSNIISITSSLNHAAFEAMMHKYGFHWPTAKDCMDVITYSTDLYWKDIKQMAPIEAFVAKLLPVERAAFVYIGDMYHLRKYNNDFIRGFLTELSRKVTDIAVPDPIKVLHSTDEQIINYVHQACMEHVRGIGKDYSKISLRDQEILAATAINITSTIEKYRDIIDAIFLSENLPASTAYIRNMIRRTVVLSDTDSTMFSVDEWVIWYYGQLTFKEEAFALSGSVMFIATQCIAHILAIFSANMGVERERIFQAAMKPEFCFPVFASTSVAKHYYTVQLVKEGNVHEHAEDEIKGVHLKNSAAPQELIKASHKRMRELIDAVMRGEKISILDELKRVASIETTIKTSLLSGKIEYYKSSKIKNPEAYAKGPDESPYLHHTLWMEVFEPKYGAVEAPPYSVVKIPTTLNNKSSLKGWIDTMADQGMAKRMSEWLTRKKKTSMNTFYVSKQYLRSYGMPAELVPIIDVKKIALDLTRTDRMILESLGYFPKHEWLISELGYDWGA